MRVRKTTFLQRKLLLWLFLISAAGYAQTATSVSPTRVTHRSSVTIIGTGFTTSSTVRFYTGTDNAVSSTAYLAATSVTYVSATEIRATLPAVITTGTGDLTRSFRVFNSTTSTTPSAAISYTYAIPRNYASTSGVSEVVTNWNNGSQTFWKSTSASGNANQQPDGSHSLMGFRYGGKMYSTGDETTITSVLNAAGYTTQNTTGTGVNDYIKGNFRALPIKNIQGVVPNSGPNLIVLASKIDGSATTQVPTAPNVAGLSVRDVLIDGIRGLNIGTGVANLPAASVLTFEASNIVADGVADGVPDILVSQIAEPTDGSFSIYSFTDAAGNIVGYPVQVAFNSTGVPVIGRYKSDFFTLPVGQPLNTAQINGSLLIGANTRDIRMVAYKIGDFGIDGTNASAAKLFKVMPSGTSDPAFMAYNRNRFQIPAPEITGQPASQALCPGGGTATFTVTVGATSSGTETPTYQWYKNGVELENGNGVSGAHAATLTINPISAVHAGAYRCLITNTAGAALSNTAYLNTIITAGADVATCAGTASPMDVSSLGNNPTYQWYKSTTNSNDNGVAVTGATSATYTPATNLAVGPHYYYVISRPAGLSCAEADVKSDVIKYTVVSAPTAGIITADESICPGGYATFTISEYTGTTIQWESSSTQTGTFTNVTGTTTATTPTLYLGSVASTTYYRAKVTSTCGTAFSEVRKVTVNDTYTWTGNVDTDWSKPGNWTCLVVPTLTTTVIIPAAPVNQPHVHTIIGLAKTLTVEAGASVTIDPAGTLQVADKVTADPEAVVTVENNGALLQDNAVENSGNIIVKRNSNSLYKLDYTLWSSPVAGQNLLAFSPLTQTTRFYEYKYGANSSNVLGEYYFPLVPSANSFVAGRSFLIRMPDNLSGNTAYNGGTAQYVFPGIFTGVPNNGNIQTQLTIGQTQAGRFYAAGNPYPSPISVAAFYNDTQNAANIEAGSAIYFWRKKNDTTVTSYATLTLSGFTANAGYPVGTVAGGTQPQTGGQDNAQYYPASGSGSNNYLSYIISPGQGFLVKLKAGAANSVVFKNTMRRAATPTATATAGQPFFRTLNAAAPSRYWLNLSNASGSYGQALVAYSQEGTTGIDYGFDGVEMADGPIRLFSRAENTNLSIQARPEFVVTDEVPMGFNVTAPGQYTVSIHDKDGVFADGQNIYLKDNLQGITHNLSDSAYSFITEAGNFNGRFEVVYMTSTLGTANPELALNNVMVYKNDNAININTGALEMMGVAIYDIRGRKLYADNNLSGTQTAITGLNIAQQVIIVEVTTVAGKVSKKIIF